MRYIIILLLLVGGSANAKSLTKAMEIVTNANERAYYQGDDAKARVKMEIEDSQGRKRERQFSILRKDVAEDGGNQNFYVYFKRPSDIAKTTFLVHKQVDGYDNRWLYLPALDLVKRIAAGDERTSFVGSHFYYEDISGRNINLDEHELWSDEGDLWQIKSTPKKDGGEEFAYYISYIDKTNYVVRKVEYYDANGKIYRIFTASDIQKIGDYLVPSVATMEDIRMGGKTTLTYDKIKFDNSLPKTIFTERSLRKLPRKYIR